MQFIKVYNTSKSILKKIDNDNIYSLIISLVKEYDAFLEMDRALECLINELLYDGYSLKYLDLWFNCNVNTKEINEENINNILENFTSLKKRQQKYKYYINVFDNGQIAEDELFIDFNMIIRKEDYDQLVMVDPKTGEDVKNYLQRSEDYTVFSIEIEAMDVYKGLEMITNAVESYFQMIKYVSGQRKNILLDKAIGQYENHIFEKLKIESFDDKILFSSVENREQEDIKDFIQYRNRIYRNQIKINEIANLQRALNIVKNQQGQQQENRVINLWAVLEYILTFHDGLSIISKVREVIPKIICLYTMKDKLNVFWSRIYNYRNNGIGIVDEFLTKCKIEQDGFYDLDKLINVIFEKNKNLIDQFIFNDLIKREIAEIGQLLTNPENRTKYIQHRHDEVMHDIVRIYRTRNTLIHSGKRLKTNLIFDSLRLFQYNNHLLGLIIYYKNKNPYSTIPEILNSINYTYFEYIKNLQNANSSPKEICKPKYLFIG